jgi:S1-C subfamily serine protease
VVQAANRVLVEFPSGEEISATVVASRPNQDVALLRLAEPASAAPARIGDSDDIAIGDQVFVVGAPLGEGHTLTAGHLSARRTERGLFFGMSTVEFLQTDAAINPGNSGGPMFNMRGEVVGIVSHILTLSGGSMGLGFAVAVNTARQVLEPGGSVWTGMAGTPVVGSLAALLNVPPPGGGIMVGSVAIGSLAESLGLRPSTIPAVIAGEEMLIGGDIILSANAIPVGANLEGLEPILQSVAELAPGETLTVRVLRDGKQLDLTARIRS